VLSCAAAATTVALPCWALAQQAEPWRIGQTAALTGPLAFPFAHEYPQRVSHLIALVDDVAFHGVAQRLAARVLQHARPVEATHPSLADELGTRREGGSRIPETFQRAGLIRLGRQRIEILDSSALGAPRPIQES